MKLRKRKLRVPKYIEEFIEESKAPDKMLEYAKPEMGIRFCKL